MFEKIKGVLARLKRKHPDIYGVLRKYCDERGLSIEDVAASALATWLASDDEAKKDLEHAMAARSSAIGRNPDVKATLELIKDVTGVMKDVFSAVSEVRTTLSIKSVVDDYKALTEAAKEIKSMGESSGAGSLDSIIAQMFLQRLIGQSPAQTKPFGKRKTGTGEVEKVGEE